MESLLMGLSYMIEANNKHKKTVVIIPARGGSKRLHRKNIVPIWGKPMISWVIESAIQSKTVDEVWVSTEDKEIKEVALSCGALVHDRDPELSTDKVFKMEAIRNCYEHIINTTGEKDIVISLQANSPEITSDIIDSAVNCFIKKDRNELISVGKDLMMNAAFRIMKSWYVFQRDLSTKTGVFVCDLVDVHTAEDIKEIESRNSK